MLETIDQLDVHFRLRRVPQAIPADIRVVFDQFVELSSEWKTLMTEKATLPKEGLSPNDKTKLSALERILREQEIEYGFSSFDPNLLQISPETYKPTREGYDIGHEASASDNVRIIWGYLQGLLELSRTIELNHLGVLILDEPRQQDARLVSFEKFAARAATAASHSQQVIFATSESKTDIAQIASRVKCQVVNFDGYLFSRL